MAKPVLIFDSSPLITLALFPIHKPAIEVVLSVVDIVIVETVAMETIAFPAHRDARVIQSFLNAGRISARPAPTTSTDHLIDAYNKVDEGERDTMRLALTVPHAGLVLDDVAAFITAQHFDLAPVMLLDLLASLARTGALAKTDALGIVGAVASRYSEAFVNHTKYK